MDYMGILGEIGGMQGLIFSAFGVFVSLWKMISKMKAKNQEKDHGTTYTTAQTRGCKYGIMEALVDSDRIKISETLQRTCSA